MGTQRARPLGAVAAPGVTFSALGRVVATTQERMEVKLMKPELIPSIKLGGFKMTLVPCPTLKNAVLFVPKCPVWRVENNKLIAEPNLMGCVLVKNIGQKTGDADHES